MRKILLVAITVILSVTSCVRRELTYTYNPTVEVVVRTDWSLMDETPSAMSVYCYPDSGGSPTVKETENIDSIVLSLGVGSYKLLVFSNDTDTFSSLSFSGLSSYETAAVYASTTTSKWYTSKSEESLVNDPDEVAAATYHDIVIPQEAIDEVLGLRTKDEYAEIDPYIYIDLQPAVVVKKAKVTTYVDGIDNLLSTRASIYGMASGYNFASQCSHEDYATHLLESWYKTVYTDDTSQGEIIAIFDCFGLPETTTNTRSDDSRGDSESDTRFDLSTWGGMLYLDALLVDGTTIESFEFVLADYTTAEDAKQSSKNDEDYYTDVDVDVDVDVDIDVDIGISISIKLSDVEASGDASSDGFGASVEGWSDEVQVEIPT